MTITAPEMFQDLAPDAPLPWTEHRFRRGIIIDAKGEEVCYIDGSDPGWRNIAAMIVVAVNTCGGFKASRSNCCDLTASVPCLDCPR